MGYKRQRVMLAVIVLKPVAVESPLLDQSSDPPARKNLRARGRSGRGRAVSDRQAGEVAEPGAGRHVPLGARGSLCVVLFRRLLERQLEADRGRGMPVELHQRDRVLGGELVPPLEQPPGGAGQRHFDRR